MLLQPEMAGMGSGRNYLSFVAVSAVSTLVVVVVNELPVH
jgi:hypothetical protein